MFLLFVHGEYIFHLIFIGFFLKEFENTFQKNAYSVIILLLQFLTKRDPKWEIQFSNFFWSGLNDMLAKFCHNVLDETKIANLCFSVLNQLHDEKKQLNNIVLFSSKKKEICDRLVMSQGLLLLIWASKRWHFICRTCLFRH